MTWVACLSSRWSWPSVKIYLWTPLLLAFLKVYLIHHLHINCYSLAFLLCWLLLSNTICRTIIHQKNLAIFLSEQAFRHEMKGMRKTYNSLFSLFLHTLSSSFFIQFCSSCIITLNHQVYIRHHSWWWVIHFPDSNNRYLN